MDVVGVRALPRLSSVRRCSGGIQWQVHVGPDGAAWRFVRDTAATQPPDVPQFLSAACAVAVLGDQAREGHRMNARWNVPEFVDLAPNLDSVRAVAIRGLSQAQKSLPAWLFYDARGSELF